MNIPDFVLNKITPAAFAVLVILGTILAALKMIEWIVTAVKTFGA